MIKPFHKAKLRSPTNNCWHSKKKKKIDEKKILRKNFQSSWKFLEKNSTISICIISIVTHMVVKPHEKRTISAGWRTSATSSKILGNFIYRFKLIIYFASKYLLKTHSTVVNSNGIEQIQTFFVRFEIDSIWLKWHLDLLNADYIWCLQSTKVM